MRTFALLLPLVLAPEAAGHQDSLASEKDARDPLVAELDAYIDGIEARGAAGVVLVAVGERVLFRRGFGHADCAGEVPMSADHIVMVGSITKEFTRQLVFLLAGENELSPEDTLGRFFPELSSGKAALTIRQLVEHEAGLPDLVDAEGRAVKYTLEYDYVPVTRDELVARVGRCEFVFAPGTDKRYSNLGYNLLAAVLEVASGERYEELLASRIFAPAGMLRTGYTFPESSGLLFAEGCRAGGARWGSPPVDAMWGADGASWNLKGAGGLLSTVDDLARWFGALGGGKLFVPELQEEYLESRLVESGRSAGRVMGPAGSNGIFNAVAYWAQTPDLRIALVTTRADFLAEREGLHRKIVGAAVRSVDSAPVR